MSKYDINCIAEAYIKVWNTIPTNNYIPLPNFLNSFELYKCHIVSSFFPEGILFDLL